MIVPNVSSSKSAALHATALRILRQCSVLAQHPLNAVIYRVNIISNPMYGAPEMTWEIVF